MDYQRHQNDDGHNGLSSIRQLTYTIDKESSNEKDNQYIINHDKIYVINISSFLTNVHFEMDQYHEYDLREPASNIVYPKKAKTERKDIPSNDWKNIPYYSNSNSLQQPQRRPQVQVQRQAPPNINVFSPQYARYVGAKPTTSSIQIGLGGVSSFDKYRNVRY